MKTTRSYVQLLCRTFNTTCIREQHKFSNQQNTHKMMINLPLSLKIIMDGWRNNLQGFQRYSTKHLSQKQARDKKQIIHTQCAKDFGPHERNTGEESSEPTGHVNIKIISIFLIMKADRNP